MPIPRLALATAATLALAGCSTMDGGSSDRVAVANLVGPSGQSAGTAQLIEAGGEYRLAVTATGLTPGAHGFHLHTTGRCDRPDFTSAGGHLDPFGRGHGFESPDGPHLGDLRNIDADAGGTATATVEMRGERSMLDAQLFDADGTAVIVHAQPDDYRTDPSGSAGARVACGVLTRR